MKTVLLMMLLEQTEDHDLTQCMDSFMRNISQTAFINVMCEEVGLLCGAFYHPDSYCEYKRAGSDPV